MNDAATPPLLFRAVKGSRSLGLVTVACALTINPSEPLPVDTIRLGWSDRIAARLREIARTAAQSGVPEGKSLPFASLRSALQAEIPEASLLSRDLGAPWKREEPISFLDVEADLLFPEVARKRAASALKTWMRLVLHPWAERVGIDDDLIEGVQDLATPDDAFTVETLKVDLLESLRQGEPLERMKHGILQLIARRLEGQELFEGLGPIYRIIRSHSSSNTIQFQTWPAKTSKEGYYSMVARLNVESGPYLDGPVITVSASRRRWHDDIPAPARLRRQKTISGSIMGRDGPKVAVEFSTPVKQGVPEEPFQPEYWIQALNVRKDLAVCLGDMVSRLGSGGVFVGVPYSSQLGGSHPVGGGTTTRDQLDLFDRVADLLEEDGFEPVSFEETVTTKKHPRRSLDQHKAFEVNALLADVALSLGRNDLDTEALQEACDRLMSGLEVPEIKPEAALRAREALEQIRETNQERVQRAFGTDRPTVAVVARTEAERATMKACIERLFGSAISVAEYQLPSGVHGPRPDLPNSEDKATGRFAARIEAWKPVAETIAKDHSGCHALVQAAEWYEKRKDDRVNKLAGRYSLASIADANVQYLRPPERKMRGFTNYLHRIQAGIYDLLFGHSGLVSEVGSLLKGCFPDEATRPKAIIGISVVTQARLRYGAPGGKICLATRIDAGTGRTQAIVGWYDRQMRWTETWEPFFEAMKLIARPEVIGTLGKTREVERASFQKFVKHVIGSSVTDGDRPLVMIDSTSAATLWPWLTDRQIGPEVTLGGERVDMSSAWPGARVVRVRTGRAGRVVERKAARYVTADALTGEPTTDIYHRYCPTITAGTIRLAEGDAVGTAHYWVTSGYFQIPLPRGLSVYRNLTSFVPAHKDKNLVLPTGLSPKGLFTEHSFDIADFTYRLPTAIDVTVARCLEGDEPDLICHAVASLREGYGHTRDSTTLPAPLSFASKARDYMTRFALDETDEEDALDEGGTEDILPLGPAPEDEADLDETPDNDETTEADVANEPVLGTDDDSESEDAGTPVLMASRALETTVSSFLRDQFIPSGDRWSDFLTAFGKGRVVQGKGLVDLHSGTALGSSKMAIPPMSHKARETGSPLLRRGNGQKRDRSSNFSKGDGFATEKSEMPDETEAQGYWPHYKKEPVLPVPDFVTLDWLRQNAAMVPANIRKLHDKREDLYKLSGAPWPEVKPSPDEFYEILLEGLKYPAFVRAVSAIVTLGMTPRKRDEFSVFSKHKPHFRNNYLRLEKDKATSARSGYVDVAVALESFIESSDVEFARDTAYIVCLSNGVEPDVLKVIQDHPSEFSDITEFMLSALEYIVSGTSLETSESTKDSKFETRTNRPEQAADTSESDASTSQAPQDQTPRPITEADGGDHHSDEVASGVTPEDAKVLMKSNNVCPTTDDGSQTWRDTMAAVRDLATKGISTEPDISMITGFTELLRTALEAAKTWESSRPRFVDASITVSAVSELSDRLAACIDDEVEKPIEIPAELESLSEADAERVEALLEKVRPTVTAAEEEHELAASIMKTGDVKRLPVAMGHAAKAKETAVGALDVLREISAILVASSAGAARPVGPAAVDRAPAPTSSEAAIEQLVQMETPDVGLGKTAAARAAPAPPAASETAAANDEDRFTEGPLDEGLEDIPEVAIATEGDDTEGSGDEESSETDGAIEALAEEPEEAPEAETDPLIAEIDARIVDLVSAGEFGLAYHLILAAQHVFVDHEFPFAEQELRLAAMAPHINHAAMQGSASLDDLTKGVLDIVLESRIDDRYAADESIASARDIIMFGAASGIALFHPNTAGGVLIEELGKNGSEAVKGLYDLAEALVEASRSGVGLSPALFRAASQEAEEDQYGDECQRLVIEKLDAIAKMSFNFVLGTKVKNALCKSDGVLGKLRSKVEGKGHSAVDAARAFHETYSSRSDAIRMLIDAEASINSRVQGIDGGARERLIAAVLSVSGACSEFVQARDAKPAMRKAGQRGIVQGVRQKILKVLETAEAAMDEYAVTSDALQSAAAKYMTRMLSILRGTVDGATQNQAASDYLLAVHGSLLWLPGLHFGNSWLPSPYQPDMVVSSILSAPVPLLRDDEDRASRLERAVRDRIDEGSFVAAQLLVEGAPFFGASEADVNGLHDMIEASAPTRRDALVNAISDVRRTLDRVQRVGFLRSVDSAQSMLSVLDGIEPEKLPADPKDSPRTEEIESGRILDFASAETVLAGVRERVEALMDKPRRDMIERLENLIASGRADSLQADRVRKLILEKDDLLTAGEFIDFLDKGQALPETTTVNRRFQAFFPAVPESLTRISNRELDVFRKAIAEGQDVGPIEYSRIPENLRDESLSLLEEWRDLRVQAHGGKSRDQIASHMLHFLERVGFKAEFRKVDTVLTKPSRKIFVAEMRLEIPTDAESLLLPDFGSQTGNNYRICIAPKMLPEHEIQSLCANAGSMGVIIFVAEAVDSDRRRQLALHSIEQNRRVLVIDEAIMLYALSEPEFRPLTLIECAQPFSFAAPYRDYGNQPVPPEIFFGRKTEVRKIAEASGSCIVYGGRRLGKTALLQYVKERLHDPSNGTVVAYVSIIDVGKSVLPSGLWEYASQNLPTVFPEPVNSHTAFTSRVRKWLDDDSRRRILVLFDESDRFIESDAETGYREFVKIQGLMDSTSRRFKFVLAGLHNVTRLVHTENPPLKQIASDPQRIGPLMDEDDLNDAERLVTQPLAAMGYEFENREDVWRILSHCNYYPVLVQTFCKGLLEILTKATTQRKHNASVITSGHVHTALEDERIVQEIGRVFDYTISEIDPRYKLIANIMAVQALYDAAVGDHGNDMKAVDILDLAISYWPSAFRTGHRLSMVEDLLDEMEGLGVLRRVGSERWTLRSHAIFRLLGSEDKITTTLKEFRDRPAPMAFEPRTMRRELKALPSFKIPSGYICPLTLGQEHDLIVSESSPQTSVLVRAIFGNALSDIQMVAPAMMTAGPLASDGTKVTVLSRTFSGVQDLSEAIRQNRARGEERAVIVVSHVSNWDGSWIEAALFEKSVRDGRIGIAFVGGPEHALKWVKDAKVHPLPPRVRTMPLQTWSAAMIHHRMNRENLSSDQFGEALARSTGGFNKLMYQVIGNNPGSAGQLQSKLDRQFRRLLDEKTLLPDLGLIEPVRPVFLQMPTWIDKDGFITAYEIREGILDELKEEVDFTAQQVVEYGVLLGLLEPDQTVMAVDEDARRFALNPLLTAVLHSLGSKEGES